MSKEKKPTSDRLSQSARQRPYAQDFSVEKHGRVTDSSFAPACDVNAIVRHYETSGIDPFVDRIKQARYADATAIPYEQAMRASAEINSAFELLPQPERARYDNDANLWFEDTIKPEPVTEAPEPADDPPIPPAEPAPQDASEPKSEA